MTRGSRRRRAQAPFEVSTEAGSLILTPDDDGDHQFVGNYQSTGKYLASYRSGRLPPGSLVAMAWYLRGVAHTICSFGSGIAPIDRTLGGLVAPDLTVEDLLSVFLSHPGTLDRRRRNIVNNNACIYKDIAFRALAGLSEIEGVSYESVLNGRID